MLDPACPTRCTPAMDAGLGEQSHDGQGAGRDGRMRDVGRLREAIRRLHGCDSFHVGSVAVHETSGDTTVWEGEVEISPSADIPQRRAPTRGAMRPTQAAGGMWPSLASTPSRRRWMQSARTSSPSMRRRNRGLSGLTRAKPPRMTDQRIDVYCRYCRRHIMRVTSRIARIVTRGSLERLRMHLRAEHRSAAVVGPAVKDVLRHFRLKARGVGPMPPSN